MFDRVLNTPLNKVWKKEGNNFPGWKVCLAYAYFFTDSRLGMLISVMLIKKHVPFIDEFVGQGLISQISSMLFLKNTFIKAY